MYSLRSIFLSPWNAEFLIHVLTRLSKASCVIQLQTSLSVRILWLSCSGFGFMETGPGFQDWLPKSLFSLPSASLKLLLFVCLLFNVLLLYWKLQVLSCLVTRRGGAGVWFCTSSQPYLEPATVSCLTVRSAVVTTQCWWWITHGEPAGCSWLIQSSRKAPFTFIFLFSHKFFSSQLQAMNFSGCLAVWVLAVWGCPLNAGHFFHVGIRLSHQQTGLEAGQVWSPWTLTMTPVLPQRFWMTPGSPSHPGLKIPHLWAPRRHNMKSTSTGVRMSVLR